MNERSEFYSWFGVTGLRTAGEIRQIVGTMQTGGAVIIEESVLPDKNLDVIRVLLESRKGD